VTGTEPIRIFVSSSSDVAEERGHAYHIINQTLQREFRSHFQLVPICWEREPILGHAHIQETIERPSSTDIFVLVVWKRIGTPLPTDKFKGAITGRAPVTGTEWEFEEALYSHQNRSRPEILIYKREEPRSVAVDKSEQFDELKQEWAACEEFWKYHFRSPTGFKLGYRSFTTPESFADYLTNDLRKLLRKRREQSRGAPVIWSHGSPFRGLTSFDLQHAPIFFGRAQAEQEVVAALSARAAAQCAFLLILGASGVGKSSLVHAGVLPALTQCDVVTGVKLWRHCLFRPGAFLTGGTDGGHRLLDGLAVVLAQETAFRQFDSDNVAKQLRADPKLGADAVKKSLEQEADAQKTPVKHARLLLVIDQLEELFTHASSQERTRFIEAIEALARSGFVWVIATLRDDFFPRLADIPALRAMSAGTGQYHLVPPTTAEITQMISEPAAAAGLEFEKTVRQPRSSGDGASEECASTQPKIDADDEKKLDAVLLEAAEKQPGALPLLEFVLDELHRIDVEQQGRKILTFETYNKIGRFEGAIAARAESVVSKFTSAQQAALDKLLLALVTVDSGGKAAARIVNRDEILPQHGETRERAEVLESLIAARLVVAVGAEQDRGSPAGSPAGKANGQGGKVRIAHEALISNWRLLRELVAERATFVQTRDSLWPDCERWQRDNHSVELLLPSGKRLEQARQLLVPYRDEFGTELAAFIEKSADHAKRQREEKDLIIQATHYWRSGLEEWQKRLAWQSRQLADRDEAGTAQAPVDPNAPQERFRRAATMMADAQKASTSLQDRQAAAEEARRLLHELTASEPANPEWRRTLAICHMTIGDISFVKGDRSGAGEAYRSALEHLGPIASDEVVEAESFRVRRIIQTRHVDLLREEGRYAEVLDAYRENLTAQEELIKRDPARREWQEDCAIIHSQIADLSQAQGDLAGALVSYKSALAIVEALHRQTPGNPNLQFTLVSLYRRVGYALFDGDEEDRDGLESALDSCRRASPIVENLVGLYPRDTSYRREQAMVMGRIGELLALQSELDDAATACNQAVEIFRNLVALDETHVVFKRFLATTLNKVGDLKLKQQDHSGALSCYQESNAIREALLQRDPTNKDLLFEVSSSYEKMSSALRDGGKFDRAITNLGEGLKIAEELWRAAPDNARRQDDVAFFRVKLAETQQRAGHPKQAEIEYRDAILARERIVLRHPDEPLWTRELLHSYVKLADVLEPDKARTELAKALERSRELLNLERGSRKSQAEFAMIERKLADLGAAAI
jgi:tetratricopeptide (TPR) repeat protein